MLYVYNMYFCDILKKIIYKNSKLVYCNYTNRKNN